MKTLRLAAATALVSSVFALSASAAEKEWWNVDFENPTPGGTNLVVGVLGPLTNDAATMAAGTVQPYASGVWSAVDSDESYVTNGLATNFVNGAMTEVANTTYLKLDTQGNDLTWTPTNGQTGVQTLVDADLYLVGSDSAPTDFDTEMDVQTAIYLKNEVDEISQKTTNSVLCVYVYNDDAKKSDWIELAGVPLTDQSWAHIQVKVDHAINKVSVKVNNVTMHESGKPSETSWDVANPESSGPAGKISSVAFRGTGAVDNFVGTTVEVETERFDFTAEVYVGTVLQNEGLTGNRTRVVTNVVSGVGTTNVFSGFVLSDYDYENLESDDVSWYLSKVEILDPATGAASSYEFTWDEDSLAIVPTVPATQNPDIRFATEVGEDDEGHEVMYQTGTFSVAASTEGAVSNAVLVKIYFTDLNAAELTPVDPGQSLDPVTDAGVVPAGVVSETDGGVTTDYFVVNFRAPEAGVTYTLMVSTDLTLTEDQWKGVGPGAATAATGDGTATSTAADELITLKVPISGNAAFFKIKASK